MKATINNNNTKNASCCKKIKIGRHSRGNRRSKTKNDETRTTSSATRKVPSILKVKTHEESMSQEFAMASSLKQKEKSRQRDRSSVGFDKVDIHYHDTVIFCNPGKLPK